MVGKTICTIIEPMCISFRKWVFQQLKFEIYNCSNLEVFDNIDKNIGLISKNKIHKTCNIYQFFKITREYCYLQRMICFLYYNVSSIDIKKNIIQIENYHIKL